MAQLQKAEIPARIKQARKEAGMTQNELAALLQVQPRTYQNYELDRVPWNLMNEIAAATGKSAEWLLHGDGVVERRPTPELFAPRDIERLERKIDLTLTRLGTLLAAQGLSDDALGDAAAAAEAAGELDEEPPPEDEEKRDDEAPGAPGS